MLGSGRSGYCSPSIWEMQPGIELQLKGKSILSVNITKGKNWIVIFFFLLVNAGKLYPWGWSLINQIRNQTGLGLTLKVVVSQDGRILKILYISFTDLQSIREECSSTERAGQQLVHVFLPDLVKTLVQRLVSFWRREARWREGRGDGERKWGWEGMREGVN